MRFETIIKNPRSKGNLIVTISIIGLALFLLGASLSISLGLFSDPLTATSYARKANIFLLIGFPVLSLIILLGGLARLFSSKRYIKIDDQSISYCLHIDRFNINNNFNENDFFGFVSGAFDMISNDNVISNDIPVERIEELKVENHNLIIVENDNQKTKTKFSLSDLSYEEEKELKKTINTFTQNAL